MVVLAVLPASRPGPPQVPWSRRRLFAGISFLVTDLSSSFLATQATATSVSCSGRLSPTTWEPTSGSSSRNGEMFITRELRIGRDP